MGLAVKLDTNGTHPEKLEKLLAQHLVDYVAMDIKNSPERYAVTCGKKTVDIENIKESIGLIMNSGTEYEFRTTVVAQLHDESSFEAIGHIVKGAEKYYLQAFADRDTGLYEGFSAPSKTQLESYLEIVRPHVKYAAIRGV